jgi:hypothetical protein
MPRESYSLSTFLARHDRPHHQQHLDDEEEVEEVSRPSARGRTRTISSDFREGWDEEDSDSDTGTIDNEVQVQSISQFEMRQHQNQLMNFSLQPDDDINHKVTSAEARAALQHLPVSTSIIQRRGEAQLQVRKAKQNNMLVDSLLKLYATESPMLGGRDKVLALLTHVEVDEDIDDNSDSEMSSDLVTSRRHEMYLSSDSSVDSLYERNMKMPGLDENDEDDQAIHEDQEIGDKHDNEEKHDEEECDNEVEMGEQHELYDQNEHDGDDEEEEEENNRGLVSSGLPLSDFLETFSKEVEEEYRMVLPFAAFRGVDAIPLSDEEEPESKHSMYKRQSELRNAVATDDHNDDDTTSGKARRVSSAL